MYERSYTNTVSRQTVPEPKKPFNWRRLIWITSIVVLIVGVLVLIKLPRLQIQSVHVEGVNVADPDDVSQFVMQQLEGTYLHVLPKTSALLVPTDAIAAKIIRAYPRFKTVTVSHTGTNALTVHVSEYEGTYLWCTDATECYFMDETGTVFSEAPYFSGSAYKKIFAGTLLPLPFHPLTDADFKTIQLLGTRLEEISIYPTEFHIISEHEIDVTFNHHGNDAVIKFDQAASIDEALSALFTGIHTPPLATGYGSKTAVLEYIDVRFSNRVVYKFK